MRAAVAHGPPFVDAGRDPGVVRAQAEVDVLVGAHGIEGGIVLVVAGHDGQLIVFDEEGVVGGVLVGVMILVFLGDWRMTTSSSRAWLRNQ